MLYKHQQEAIELAVKNSGNLALLHDCGTGKTRTMLEIFRKLREQTPHLRMFVAMPLSLIHAAWGNDIAKFTDFRYVPFNDLKPGQTDFDITGINFESLITEIRFKKIQSMLAAGAWMLAIDESSRLKAHKSQTTKCLLKLAPYARHRLIASGTPAPNSEQEFWGQVKFVKPDILPDSFYQFRNQYFHLSRGNQVQSMQGRVMSRMAMADMFQRGWKYAITPEKRKELMERIDTISHWVKKEEALDLPDKVNEIRLIKLNPNERKAYNDMKNHLVAELKTGRQRFGEQETVTVTAEVALAKLMKLRQMGSGFCYDENHNAYYAGKSSKLRELGYLLEEVGNRQVIIWIQFHEEVRVIEELLQKQGKSWATLYSGTEDKDKSISDFQTGKAQALICHPRSAAHGLTFVNCDTAIYFSLDYSYEAYQQSQDRIHRIGQHNKCTYIHLVAENTIDQGIMDVLSRKKSLQDLIHELVRED